MTNTNNLTIGRRKTSVARVKMFPGSGKIIVNKREVDDYFGRVSHRKQIFQVLELVNCQDKYDVVVNVRGGGLSGQAGAICHGIARSLVNIDSNHKPVLKKAGLLTRDARMKERKKYGRKGARRAFQWTKR